MTGVQTCALPICDDLRCFRRDGSVANLSLTSGGHLDTKATGDSDTKDFTGQGRVGTSRNGRFTIIWDGQHSVTVRSADPSSIDELRHTLPAKPEVTVVAVADDGSRWAVGCRSGNMWLGTSNAAQAPRCLESGKQPVYGIDITWDGKWIAAVDKDGVLRVWDINEGKIGRAHV